MNNYAYLIKAKAKSQAKTLFCWFSAKSDSRAEREILNLLEDKEIDVGRGADYQLPVRTNWFIVDDLPEEGVLDDTWCDRYELMEDGLTWQKIVAAPTPTPTSVAQDAADVAGEDSSNQSTLSEEKVIDLHAYGKYSFEKKVFGTWLYGIFDNLTSEQLQEIARVELDMDETYAQNVMLAARDFKARPIEHVFPETLADLFTATKSIWPANGKAPMLNDLITFFAEWINTHQSDRASRDDVTAKWFAKHNKATPDKQPIVRTDVGTNAGGGNKTDRNPELTHTLDSLDIEIALATLPMDFNIYDIPGGVYRRAKEIVSKKESPFKEWSSALRKRAGILDYSRAAIFALIREAREDIHNFPELLSRHINKCLTESKHEKPSEETLKAARHNPEESWEKEISEKLATEHQPEIANIGGGIYSVEGLLGQSELAKDDTPQQETISNDQTEAKHVAACEVSEAPASSAADSSHDEIVESTDDLNIESGNQIAEAGCLLSAHVMVDLETMGTGPDAPIVSIGAAFFDPKTGNTGESFYKVIKLESAMDWGAVPDASTIVWWLKQSPEARSAIVMDDAIPLDDALLQFSDFICENSLNSSSAVQVWGNGATFDNVLLRRSYNRCGISCPWKFTNDRDVRTIVAMGEAVNCTPRYEIPFEGDMHNALADALHQIKYVSVIWQQLTGN